MPQYQFTQARRYDPQAIAQYYRNRPWKAIWRAITVIWSFAGFVLGMLWDSWQHEVAAHQPERAAHLRQILTRLGPTFIKVGQALSTRPDLIRKDFLEELIKLQDQLPPFDSARAFEIIEAELDRKISATYSEISPNLSPRQVSVKSTEPPPHRGSSSSQGSATEFAASLEPRSLFNALGGWIVGPVAAAESRSRPLFNSR